MLLTTGLEFFRSPTISMEKRSSLAKAHGSGRGGMLLHVLSITLWSTEALFIADLIYNEHAPASQYLSCLHTHRTSVCQDVARLLQLHGAAPEKHSQYNPAPCIPGKETRKPVSPSSLNGIPVSTWTPRRKRRRQAHRDTEGWGAWEPVLEEEEVATRKQ